MKLRRRQVLTLAIVAGALVLVILLGLIAAGILVLPGSPGPSPVTVSRVQFKILQGTNASGLPWFGPSEFNYTGVGSGYPVSVGAGGAFSVIVGLLNYDTQNHTIYSITAAPPFTLNRTTPIAPFVAPVSVETNYVWIYLVAPNTAGDSYVLYITIDALNP